MGLAFALVDAVLSVDGDGPRGWAGLLTLALFVVLLTVGQMVVLPLTRALVPALAGERRLGTHYGLLASVSGLAVLVGSTGLGAVVQLAPGLAAAWWVAASLPAGSALVVGRVLRRQRVARTDPR